jgi:hypothetical protein
LITWVNSTNLPNSTNLTRDDSFFPIDDSFFPIDDSFFPIDDSYVDDQVIQNKKKLIKKKANINKTT